MGRSRGGLSTKIHALVDAEGRPIRITLTPGQAHDGSAAEELLADLKPGTTLLADKAYDSNAIREQALEQDVWANIPPHEQPQGFVCPQRLSVSLQKPRGDGLITNDKF